MSSIPQANTWGFSLVRRFSMIPITHKEAIEKYCPFIVIKEKNIKCLGHNCIAWKEINPRIEREDHSGGKQMIYEQRSRRNMQEIKRSGPIGSTGIFILDAQGVCLRLYNTKI